MLASVARPEILKYPRVLFVDNRSSKHGTYVNQVVKLPPVMYTSMTNVMNIKYHFHVTWFWESTHAPNQGIITEEYQKKL